MKKNYILFFLAFFWFISKSQNPSIPFENIKQLIKQADPKANIDDKLVFVSFWTPNNNQSRELNKEIQRVQNIYQVAKLKGGNKGLYFFNYCIAEDVLNYKLALKRDSLQARSSLIQNEETKQLINNLSASQVPLTILYNSAGEVLESGTKKEDVFKLISKQITR
jgi:Skp family chaperone for outer membrane proteins